MYHAQVYYKDSHYRVLLQEVTGARLVYEGRGTDQLADYIARKAKGRTDGFNNICILSDPSSDCMKLYVMEKQQCRGTSVNLSDPMRRSQLIVPDTIVTT